VAAPIRRVNRQIESITRPLRKVRVQMRALGREAGFQKLGQALGGVGAQLRRLAFIGGASLGALGAAVLKTATSADALGKFARQLDLPVRRLQQLRFQADRLGVSNETLERSLFALSKRTGELKAGSGGLFSLLNRTDPALAKRLARTTDTAEALDLVLEALANLPTASQRSALAAAAFSRSGLGMIRIAAVGRGELGRLADELDRYGDVLDEKAIANSEGLLDAVTNLKAALGGLVKQVSASLFPAVTELSQGLANWIAQNREVIVPGVVSFLREFASGVSAVVGFLREAAPTLKAVIDRLGGVRFVAAAVAALIVGPLLLAIGAVGAALFSTAGLIAAGIAAVLAAGGALIVYWDDLKAAAAGALDFIAQKLRGLVGLLPSGVVDFVGSLFGGGDAAASAGGRTAPAQTVPGGFAAPELAPASGRIEGELRITVDQRGQVESAELDPGPGNDAQLVDAGLVLSPAF